MPAYSITDPDSGKVRAVEVHNPQAARAHAAKRLKVKRLGSREIFELAQAGVELETPGKKG
jgi:hypothetical protein